MRHAEFPNCDLLNTDNNLRTTMFSVIDSMPPLHTHKIWGYSIGSSTTKKVSNQRSLSVAASIRDSCRQSALNAIIFTQGINRYHTRKKSVTP